MSIMTYFPSPFIVIIYTHRTACYLWVSRCGWALTVETYTSWTCKQLLVSWCTSAHYYDCCDPSNGNFLLLSVAIISIGYLAYVLYRGTFMCIIITIDQNNVLLWKTSYMYWMMSRFYFLRVVYQNLITQCYSIPTDVSQISYLEDAPKDLMLNQNGRSVVHHRTINTLHNVYDLWMSIELDPIVIIQTYVYARTKKTVDVSYDNYYSLAWCGVCCSTGYF